MRVIEEDVKEMWTDVVVARGREWRVVGSP